MGNFSIDTKAIKKIIGNESNIENHLNKTALQIDALASSFTYNNGYIESRKELTSIANDIREQNKVMTELKNTLIAISKLYESAEKAIICGSILINKSALLNKYNSGSNDYNANIINRKLDEYGITTEDIECLENNYGLTEEEAILLARTINLLGESCPFEKNSPAYINYIYGTLSTLCISYDAKRWRATTGQPHLWQAKNRLYFAGLSKQDILDLQVIINLQHGDFSYDTLKENGIDIENSHFPDETFTKMQNRCIDPNNDFAHQAVQITAFAQGDMMYEDGYFSFSRYCIDLFNSNDFLYSYTDYEISFKGDIDSGRYSESDFQSDVDAVNIYNRMKNNESNSVHTIWSDYYSQVRDGSTNRAKEFCASFGDGEPDIGLIAVNDLLNTQTFGSIYIQDGKSEESQTTAKQTFMQWLLAEYCDMEYDFPEE